MKELYDVPHDNSDKMVFYSCHFVAITFNHDFS